jgi:hypothetical protein
MNFQNLAYALTQVAHNFGAVVVVAAPLYVVLARPALRRGMLALVLGGWVVQVLSGVVFGLVSLYYYGRLPDLHGPAIAALSIKMLSAGTALALIVAAWRFSARWTQRAVASMWSGLAVLGLTAITAAAFLRWYS